MGGTCSTRWKDEGCKQYLKGAGNLRVLGSGWSIRICLDEIGYEAVETNQWVRTGLCAKAPLSRTLILLGISWWLSIRLPRTLFRGVSPPNLKHFTSMKHYRKFSNNCTLMLHAVGGLRLMVACNNSTTPVWSDPMLLAPWWCPLFLTHFADWWNNMSCLQYIYLAEHVMLCCMFSKSFFTASQRVRRFG